MRHSIKNLALAAAYTFVLSTTLMVIITVFSMAARGDAISNLRRTAAHVYNATGSIVRGKSGATYILTNWHVCTLSDNASNVLEAKFDNGTSISGMIVANDASVDLCAARVYKRLPALELSKDTQEVREFYTRGYPGGVLYEGHGVIQRKMEWDYEIAIRIIKKCPKGSKIKFWEDGAPRSCLLHWSSVVTTLYGRPGSSGSPVLDNEGNLVGVISSHEYPDYPFAAGMVPTENLRLFLEKL